jgi:phosphatidylglycerophosphatase A
MSEQQSDPAAARPTLAVAVSTVFGVGFLPLAPGTWGAALAVPSFVIFSPMHPGLLALSWLALCCLGIWASDVAGPFFGRTDDGRIVIDEVAGQLLALAPLVAVPEAIALPWLVTGFVAFRLFDIWKPGPVGWAERRLRGGLGVMMDDVVAGALAAGVVALGLAVVTTGGTA